MRSRHRRSPRPGAHAPLARLSRGGWLLALLAASGAAPAAAQGWIEPLPGRPIVEGWSVERTLSRVRVVVEGRVARVEVTERFRNRSRGVAEGSYLYPLPGEAAFSSFSLFQGETELLGEIMDRERAREVYEDIVRRRADPALIELAGHGLLRARVFPLEPGEEREVILRYEQLLSRAGDALHFQYAGGVREAGRVFGAREPLEGPPRRRDGSGGGARPPVDAATDVELVVDDASRFLQPFSPTHALDVTPEPRSGGGRRLVVRAREGVSGHLSIFLPLVRDGLGVTVVAHAPAGGEAGYFMVTLSPGPARGPAPSRDVTAVVDVSGSMSGEKIEQARSALLGLLASLEPRDRFRLISFSNVVSPESDGWQTADTASVRRAVAWVGRLSANGGTNIEGALDEAFRVAPGASRLPVVLFLTDGLPTVGERDPEAIADRAESRRGAARVFAFGVGDDVNTHLLDRLSAATRGATDYVRAGENVERAVSLLTTRIRHPVLTDLEWAGAPVRVREVYPVDIPDVFAGEELVLFGRYEGQGRGEMALAGRRGERAERFAVDADFPRRSDDNAFIPRLWASRKLGHLTRQLWMEGRSESLVEEIRRTALRYGLPSEFTAYLVTEPEAVAAAPRDGAFPSRQGRALPEMAVAGAPAASSGAGAVRAADEARRMRSVTATADLAKAELDAAASVAPGMRTVAGRLFQERDGVWLEVGLPDALPTLAVRRYSRAWFDLLQALPELAAPARELGRVALRGHGLSVRFDDEGVDVLTDARLLETVGRFRGSPTP